MEFFRVGKVNKTSFGSYRVELIVSALHRVLDLHNFECVLMVLTSEEHAQLLARVGWLTIFNPCKAEGCYEFDFARREERQVCIYFPSGYLNFFYYIFIQCTCSAVL